MLHNFMQDRKQQRLLLEGQHFSREQILEQCVQYREDTGYRGDLFRFLAEWFDDTPSMLIHTSGSTGVPKLIELEKDRMIQSACLTCSHLGLRPGDSVLLCMPLQFIGAKMIVVRALVASLDLHCVEPSTHPLRDFDTALVFAAMTPQQAWGCLERPEEEARLRKVRHLLLGGMAVSVELQTRLADFPHAVWSSYGMTETLSHIALCKINGEDAADCFTPFIGVELSISDIGTLVIHAPVLCKDTLITTDIAEILPDGCFRILGRADTMINSGGVKIQIEAVEEALAQYFSQPFQITALPDANLGKQLVLLVEDECLAWDSKCSHLPKYWKPRQILIVPKLPFTDSGKPDRCQARKLAETHSSLSLKCGKKHE